MRHRLGYYELPALGKELGSLDEQIVHKYATYHWISPELVRRNDAYQVTWEMILWENPAAMQPSMDAVLDYALTAIQYLASDEGLQEKEMARRVVQRLYPALIRFAEESNLGVIYMSEISRSFALLTIEPIGPLPLHLRDVPQELMDCVAEEIVKNDKNPSVRYEEVNRALDALIDIPYLWKTSQWQYPLTRIVDHIFRTDTFPEGQDAYRRILYEQAMKGMT